MWVMTEDQYWAVMNYVLPLAVGFGWVLHWIWEQKIRDNVQEYLEKKFKVKDA
jgi:hypothetical protein